MQFTEDLLLALAVHMTDEQFSLLSKTSGELRSMLKKVTANPYFWYLRTVKLSQKNLTLTGGGYMNAWYSTILTICLLSIQA